MENKDVKILSFDNSDVDTTVFNESTSSSSICSTMPRWSKRTSVGYISSLENLVKKLVKGPRRFRWVCQCDWRFSCL